MRFVPVMASLLFACVAFLAAPGALRAEEPVTKDLKFTIEGMHCEGCALRVKKNLQAVKFVKEVQVDVEKGLATIKTLDDGKPSTKEMWETIEKLGYKPVSLATPEGKITEKPKS